MKYQVIKESVNEILTETEKNNMLPFLENLSFSDSSKFEDLSIKKLFDLFVLSHLLTQKAKEMYVKKSFSLKKEFGDAEVRSLIKQTEEGELFHKASKSYRTMCMITNRLRTNIEYKYGLQIDKMAKELILILVEESRSSNSERDFKKDKKVILEKIENVSKLEEEKDRE